MNWLAFWQALLPEMIKLGRALFDAHSGDVDAARAAVMDHRSRLKIAEAKIDDRIDAAEAKAASKPKKG